MSGSSAPSRCGRARRVHRRVAAAVDGDAPAQSRGLSPAVSTSFEKLQRVVDLAGVPRGDLLPLAQVRADGEEHGVESARGLLGHEVLDFVVEDDLDAHVCDARRSRRRALRAAGGTWGCRSASCRRPAVPPRGSRPRGRGSARCHAAERPLGPAPTTSTRLAGWRLVGRDRPPLPERHVAQEPLDGVDADRLVHVLAVARVLARVIADAAVHRRHRIVADDDLPGLAVAAGLRLGEPGLDVLAGRAARGCTAAGGPRRAAASCAPAPSSKLLLLRGGEQLASHSTCAPSSARFFTLALYSTAGISPVLRKNPLQVAPDNPFRIRPDSLPHSEAWAALPSNWAYEARDAHEQARFGKAESCNGWSP